MSDLTYKTDGFFLTIMPETDAGVAAYNVIAKAYNGEKAPHSHLASIRASLKKSGMTIRKDTKKAPSLEDIFAELEAA